MKNKTPAKRVDIVTLKLVRESSMLYQTRSVKSPGDAADLVRNFIEDADREQFWIACLDTRHQPTALHAVSIGTLSQTVVHPRELFKAAIIANAAAVILYHNHPSGDPEPSRQDIEITERLVKAGEILGIQVLDHLVIGSNGKYVSLKERGLMGQDQ
ncbi:JAB domain-containing protein [Desulfallas thermosapovorans]|uniref:DNA repair protein RadC n=1 Tax=Desulfallas thermosapovorans DSM 6562 TaxID=1121431 RepID=A0A5S4ZRG1_9FIRM|nr:DNA repair protein RadC [Desulfallas thermosapovorans]TYO95504.1 DNA repair protein RadC [Desulfallas thermosapovorans DSM 6562]